MTPVIPFLLASLVTLLPNAAPPPNCEAQVVRDVVVPATVPAGTVKFPHDRQLAACERIRLVSLLQPREGNAVRALFTRDVVSLPAEPRMPAGPAIALLLDAKERAIGASPVFNVRAGATIEVWPTAGAETFIAWLKRPRVIEREDDDRVALKAFDVAPNIFVNAADSVFAVWSGVSAREARVVVDSNTLRLANDTVSVARTSLTMFEEPLQLLPVLTVALSTLPEGTTSMPMSLAIAETAQSRKILRTLETHAGETLTIAALPAAPLTLQLRIGEFMLRRSADLTSGADARVDIALEPLTLSGTVFLGDEPARAIVRIQQGEKPLATTTDERGAYSFTLWQSGRYVIDAVLAAQPDMPAFSQFTRISGATTLDIHIPANSLCARVYDAVTKKPIEGAQVIVHNRWTGGAVVGSVATSANELTLLPPQRPGTSEIHVRAAGYREPAGITITVDEATRERMIDIPLTPGTDGKALSIRLPNGTAAVDAEVASWVGDQLAWHGVADAAGRVTIPENVLQSRLVVRHPSAASELLLPGAVAAMEVLTLAPSAPPLVVKAVRKNGTNAGPQPARLALWLAGVRLTGLEAGYATWTSALTSIDGTMMLRGLAARPLRLFASRNASAEQIATGTFDGLAMTVPYPWPATATLTLVDE